MKRLRLSHIALVTVVLTFLWCAWLRRDGLPPLYSRATQMDLNSGDIRDQGYVLGRIRIRNRIHETRLSKEVHRLGIAIPGAPAWEGIYRHAGSGVFSDGGLAFSSGKCHRLVLLLEETNAPDDERRVILAQMMDTLRAGLRDRDIQLLVLLDEVAERHGVQVLDLQVRDQLRKLRNADEPNSAK